MGFGMLESPMSPRVTADPILGDGLTDDDKAKRTHHERGRPQASVPESRAEARWAGHQAGSNEIDIEWCPEMNRQQAGRISADPEEGRLGER